jgi:formylglycine-generating enzyme required for sulfatase activity/tRNA A-37 threonylcarbamoyl transferase component Bud32
MSWGTGQKLNNDRYEILQRIGTGGFGVTYKAIDTKAAMPGQVVAIKTLNEKRQRQPNFEQLQENFLNEAMALAKCTHLYVIRVERVFNEGPLWAMVMEYVEGESLDDWLDDRGPMAEVRAVEIIQKIGEAVSYVHDRGMLHRDIKPMNIMIRSNGEPVLIDFGLAREFVAGIARSMTSDRTPHYAPPEQRERRGEFTPSLDVYALAATLYSCVTGELPAMADIRVVRENLIPPQELNPQVSDWVNAAILRGMALQVADRSATVAEWLELLQPAIGCSEHRKFSFETAVIEFGGIFGKKLNIIRQTKEVEYYREELGNGVGLEMVAVPAGSFLMGAPVGDEVSIDSERPQHLVQVPGFYVGKYPVTQNQYLAVMGVMGKNLAHFQGGELPVERMSWHDAQEFCAELSRMSGKTYRLPSEAEWEYACRAGTTTPFYFGEMIVSELANFDGNYGKTSPVGAYKVANDFGLYDMHGNVWEWCEDAWHGNYQGAPTDGSAWVEKSENDNYYRLMRGGSWYDNPLICRSALRNWGAAVNRNYFVGFRVVVSQDS